MLDEGGIKVRWVGCGYSQIWGKDYWGTYAACPKATGIRLFAAITALHDLDTTSWRMQ